MKKNSFVEGTIIASVVIILVKILGALYVIPFYRIIGDEGGVLYSYAYNIYNLFLSISITGFPIAMSKLISEYNTKGLGDAKDRTYKICRNIILIISVLCFTILFFFAEQFGRLIIGNMINGSKIEDIAFVIRIISFSLLVIPFLSITRGYLQGHKYMKESSNSQLIEQIIRIFIVLVGSYLAIKVFNKSITLGVAIALSGAFFGGLAAYLYLKFKINKNKDNFKCDNVDNTVIESKEIVKKFITYSIPSIIIAVVGSIYDLTDMILIIRGCNLIGISGSDAEIIASIISNWGAKICMVLTAVATAISINIIPHLTSIFVEKDYTKLNEKFVQSINTTLVISIPMAIGISLLAMPVYSLFYGENMYGGIILQVMVFASLFANFNTVINMSLIGLNRYKIIYLTNIIGIVINLALDIPLMLLLNKLNIFPMWGASFATIIGYSISYIICFKLIKKDFNFSYSKIGKCLVKMILPILVMTIPLIIANGFMNYKEFSNTENIIIIFLYLIFGALVYFFVSYKNKLLELALGKEYLDKLLIKLRLKGK